MDNLGEMSGSHSQQGSDKSRWQKIGGLAQLKQLPNSYWAEPKEETEPILDAPVEQVGQQTPEPEKQLPWQERYPDLYKEMIENHVPMDPKKFKEEGYEFIKHDDGSRHVAYPTPEYTEWLKADPENRGLRPPVHHEELAERTERQRLESIREAKRQHLNSIKDATTPLVYEFVDRLVSEENDKYSELKKRISNTDLNEFKNKVINKVALLVDSEHQILEDMQKNRSSKWEYEGILESALENGNTDFSDNACVRYLSMALPDITAKFYQPSDAREVAVMMLKESQKGLIEDEEFQKVVTKNDWCKAQAVNSSVFRGIFPVRDKDGADKLLSEYSKFDSHDKLMRYAFLGYQKIRAKKKRDAFESYFGISDYFAEKLEDRRSGLIRGTDGDFCLKSYSSLNPSSKDDKLPSGLQSKIKERFEEMRNELMEQFQNDPDLLAEIESSKHNFAQNESERLFEKILQGKNIDIEEYLNIASVRIDPDRLAAKIFIKRKDNLCHLIRDRDILESILEKHPLGEIDVDYKTILGGIIKECLCEGTCCIIPQTAFFESESFRENQEKLGIDFGDPEIMELAFNGFLNVLSADNYNWRGGEKTEQLNWYYNNIFANDPGKFFMMEKAMRATSDNVGLKNRFTRFYKICPEAQEDRIIWESERLRQRDINSEHRMVKPSILEKVERGKVQKILNDYKKRLIDEMRGRNAETIITFIDRNPAPRTEEDREERERKEAPFDFGLEKGRALLRYGDYVNENIPGANVEWFIDIFPVDGNNNEIYDQDDSYIGFSFLYEGKRCVFAESLNETAGTYLWRGEDGEDFKQLFDLPKNDTRRSTDPRIAAFNHLDKEHCDESLDMAYKKAFLFFRTGDKLAVFYETLGGRDNWKKYQAAEFPAWPIDITGEAENYPDDLEKYKQWQGRQAVTEQRLKDAIERGGIDEYERERERIAEENYERIQEEQ